MTADQIEDDVNAIHAALHRLVECGALGSDIAFNMGKTLYKYLRSDLPIPAAYLPQWKDIPYHPVNVSKSVEAEEGLIKNASTISDKAEPQERPTGSEGYKEASVNVKKGFKALKPHQKEHPQKPEPKSAQGLPFTVFDKPGLEGGSDFKAITNPKNDVAPPPSSYLIELATLEDNISVGVDGLGEEKLPNLCGSDKVSDHATCTEAQTKKEEFILRPRAAPPTTTSAPAPSSTPSQGRKKYSTMVCPHWASARAFEWKRSPCGHLGDHGVFMHREVPGLPVEILECPYNKQGHCNKGATCKYEHKPTRHGLAAALPRDLSKKNRQNPKPRPTEIQRERWW
ncbi:hypothetical protein VM1G_08046 [Cytospora mali]|uniref:C3H1-type domain-containing protein n=1 Tax=Cytospora mali TaxID=578113 RepID=A0A194W6I7_CYTMA|nr:hypothetical protein VM1G_08046 [Valsa mali]